MKRNCRDCGAAYAVEKKKGRPPVKCAACRTKTKKESPKSV